HLSNQLTGPRSNSQIQIERDDRWNATERAIDEIHSYYLAQWGTKNRADVAIIYARYSTRHQDSIADQVRSLLTHALRLNLYVPRDLIFFDLAIRGVTRHRHGLGLAENALRERRGRNLLLFSTSRLFRKTYRTLEFVDRIHKGLQVRCVFVQSGIDTND